MKLAPWLAALAALSGIVLLAHVIRPAGGVPFRLHGVMDVAHVLGFAGFTWLVADRAWRVADAERWSGPAAFAGAVAFAFVLACVAEVIQGGVGREPSWGDLLRDVGGIAAGAIFCLVAARGLRPRTVWVGGACALLAVMLWEPGRIVSAVAAARLRLPVLATFESKLEDALYAGVYAELSIRAADPAWPSPGHVAHVQPIDGHRYAGIGFVRLPADWTAYSALRFVISADAPTVQPFTVRINDIGHDWRYEDRYNASFEMGPVPTTIRLSLDDVRHAPAGRELDLGRIEQLAVFVDTAEAGGFSIDDVRLE